MFPTRRSRKYLAASPTAADRNLKEFFFPECRKRVIGILNRVNADAGRKCSVQMVRDWHLCLNGSLANDCTRRVLDLSRRDWANESDGLLSVEAADEEFVEFSAHVRDAWGQDRYPGFAADLPIDTGQTWQRLTIAGPFDGIFGNRSQAGRLIGIDGLREGCAKGEGDGTGVNVVVIDKGLDADEVTRAGATFAGGWTTDPKTRPPGRTHGSRATHGSMLLRNILHAAPKARIWDCPLIEDAPSATFLADATGAFLRIVEDITRLRQCEGWQDSCWVLVNAWGVYETRRPDLPPEQYNSNPDHPLNQLVAKAADANIDLVFCAGNCGEFWPDIRCRANDTGPGRSIYGVNGHPKVLTAGAVRVDEIWLGYSSQGPGQPELASGKTPVELAREKPDLCLPSHFCEDDDAQSINTGTSAACALAAGVVAALRSRKGAHRLPAEHIKAVLRATARQLPGLEKWDNRLGRGVLDAAAAAKEI